jgi:hypothetical protein
MTRILEALDYSRPVQPLFAQAARSGFIHSTFPGALNIVVDETLFVLLSAERPRMPNGARMPGDVVEQLYTELSPGVEVSVGDGRLLIPTLDLCIHLPEKMAWEPVPALAAYSWQSAAAAGHARMLARLLAQRSQQDGLAPLVRPLLFDEAIRETPLARVALPLLCLLAQASRELDWAGVEEAARGLAGLGPGLTPSGDDTLGGFMGVMALIGLQDGGREYECEENNKGSSTTFRHRRRDRTAGQRLAEVIASAARPRTTILSATLLAHAARGELAEQVGELLMALALPAAERAVVLRAAERVLAFGACSGGDTLLGLLLGLKAAGIFGSINNRVPGRPPGSPLPYTKEIMSTSLGAEPLHGRRLW